MSTPNDSTLIDASSTPDSRVGSDGGFGVWSPIATAKTRKTIGDPCVRCLLLCGSGRVEIGWHDSDQYAKRPRPYWGLEGRHGRTLDMRGDQPTHWMPLPPNTKMSHGSAANT